jgi:hypothetical protein
MIAASAAGAGIVDNPNYHYCGATRVWWKAGCRPTVPCPPGMVGRWGGSNAFNIKNCHKPGLLHQPVDMRAVNSRPAQLAASFISDARTLILTLNRPGWLCPAASECPSISAAARLAAWQCSPLAPTIRQSKSWEPRHEHGAAPVYGWFTEGFDTLDLKETKALLKRLAE